MPIFHLLLMAVIQGLTEFLPVSSSGHLIVIPLILELPDLGQALDVAVHVGSLAAVIVFLRAEVALVLRGAARLAGGDWRAPEGRFALRLAVATVPVLAAGLALSLSGIDDLLRSVAVIGWTMIVFGLFLWWADRRGPQTRREADWSMRDAVVMGLWQAVALIPGTSRSGITISAARLLGYAREDAARLSMLMSIPTIAASGALLGLEVVADADWAMLRAAAVAAVFAFVSALLALWAMIRLLRRIDFTPYVVYRVILGAVLLWVAYT